MWEERRRLAAILAADVAGYSRLMAADEAGTLARLKRLRAAVFEPKIARFDGRIVGSAGDSLLIEFASAVNAVQCAVEVQRELGDQNASLPEDRRMLFRMGVNLGDVIVEDNTIHGDGVNIAARLEKLSEPGGICIGRTIHDQVKGKLAYAYDDLGEQRVHNIPEPVRAYRVLMDPAAAGKTVVVQRAHLWRRSVAAVLLLLAFAAVALAWWSGWHRDDMVETAADAKPSLVVLPFNNLSDDKEQGYLADGITEDLTTDLAQIPGLFVISRAAAFSYKGQNIQPAQIAADLQVRYLLEGSVRRAGDYMRINAQLIDAETGGHVWAERFDGPWADVFSLQNKVVENVAQALQLRLTSGNRTLSGGTSNVAAYEAYLKGWELVLRNNAEDYAKAVSQFEQAIALDPDYGQAYAALASSYLKAWSPGEWQETLGMPTSAIAKKFTASLQEALMRPTPEAYRVNAYLLQSQFKFDEAIATLEQAIMLDPSDADSYARMGEMLVYAGRIADGKEYIDGAFRLDPRSIRWRHFAEGLVLFSSNRFEEASVALKKGRPDFRSMMLELSAYGHLGRSAEADSLLKDINRYNAQTGDPNMTILFARGFWKFREHTDIARVLDGLRNAGVPELPSSYDAKSKDKLTGDQIKSLIFGHVLVGREIESGSPFTRNVSVDGAVSVTVGGWSDKGVARVEDDAMCSWFLTRDHTCAVVFRNPAGTFEEKNEYLLVRPWNAFEFSVFK